MRLYHIYYTTKDRIKDQSLYMEDCFQEIAFWIKKKYGIKDANISIERSKQYDMEIIPIIATKHPFYREFTLKLDLAEPEIDSICCNCGEELKSIYIYKDRQNNKDYCKYCFNGIFAWKHKAKDLKWFEDNFERNEYPKGFWDELEG